MNVCLKCVHRVVNGHGSGSRCDVYEEQDPDHSDSCLMYKPEVEIPLPTPEDAPAPLFTTNEAVDHPKHYQGHKYEVISVIEDFKLNFALGNAVKYILRAGKKDDAKQDLEKAVWYLKHEIERMEESNGRD